MYQIESHEIKVSNKYFKLIANFCDTARKLYNAANYQQRFNYLVLTNSLITYPKMDNILKNNSTDLYRAMPSAQCAQQVIRQNCSDWSSFLKANKPYSKNPSKFKGKPKPPKYNNNYGSGTLLFTNQNIRCKDNTIFFPKTMNGFTLKPHISIDSVKFVEIVRINPRLYRANIGYVVNCKEPIVNKNYASIDIGVNNLAALTFTNNSPIIINGRPLKSINQYYNKLFCYIEKYKLSKKYLYAICRKRNNKIKDYMHKASTYIVNQLVSNNISTLVIGYNQDWKQGTHMDKVHNQNFQHIPFYLFKKMLTYKCYLKGITVVTIDEAYTSKCSFLDDEEICWHEKYMGNRKHRGLYETKTGITINADVNGSYNIMKKYLNAVENINIYELINSIEAVMVPPIKISF